MMTDGVVTVKGLQGKPLSATPALHNQVLTWNETNGQWEPGAVNLDLAAYSEPQDRTSAFDATAFVQASNLEVGSARFTDDSGEAIYVKSALPGTLVVPLQLPHHVEITEVEVLCYDLDAANDIKVELYEKDLTGFSSTVRTSVIASGISSGNYTSRVPVFSLVTDNTRFAYKLKITLHGYLTTPQQYVYGALVHYRVTQPD
jgi:hypothetical protein